MRELILHLSQFSDDVLTLDFLKKQKREYAREKKMKNVPSNIQLLRDYHQLVREKKIQENKHLASVLRKRPVRSMSGIVSVQVLTKPFWCPGKCIFCPNDFTMPKSYINTEPGAMRALMNNFDPVKQVYNRLLSLTLTGHVTDKIEMIVLGGTWDVYPQDYKEQFVKSLYDACNTFPEYFQTVELGNTDLMKSFHFTAQSDFSPVVPDTLEETLHTNETAKNRIIGLTVETRPEYVNDENCQFWRRLGVTRLEMGIQSTDNDVLVANKRGHDVQDSCRAVHTLRKYGFKMSVHLMPGLYKSTYEKDVKTFEDVYDNIFLKPDEIKFYPTSVIPNTELYDLYREGEYKPLETEQITKMIRKTFLDIIPPYTRIKRLIRDIPSTEIVAGSSITNLSQLTHAQMKKELRGTQKIHDLYERLYGEYDLFSSFDEWETSLADYTYKNDQKRENDPMDQSFFDPKISCAIIGEVPDVQEYRNFVSLDTRSREIRQKYKKADGLPSKPKEESVANLVIRKYQSSV